VKGLSFGKYIAGKSFGGRNDSGGVVPMGPESDLQPMIRNEQKMREGTRRFFIDETGMNKNKNEFYASAKVFHCIGTGVCRALKQCFFNAKTFN
jgi:hypothetical protein